MVDMLLVILLLILTVLYLYFKFGVGKPSYEGFTQDAPYVLKRGAEIYDDFYAQIYDTVRPNDPRIVPALLKMSVGFGKKNARILVVGCKTGEVVGEFAKSGIHTVGIDTSKSMIQVAKQKYSDGSFRVADPMNPMIYDPAQFSHVVCVDFGIYELENYRQLFQNAQTWLPIGGDLVVHLVDPDKFTVAPVKDERILQKEVEYPDFVYKVRWEFHLPKATVKETFTDRETHNVRENERTMDMPEANAILVEAGKYGFVAKRNFPLSDPHQYIYILERTT